MKLPDGTTTIAGQSVHSWKIVLGLQRTLGIRCEQIGAHIGEPIDALPEIGLIPPADETQDDPGHQHADEDLHAALAARRGAALALGAAEDFVGGDAEQSGDDLGEGEVLAVAVLARVGGEQLGPVGSDVTARIERVFERRRKAFAFRIVGLAVDDQRDHRTLGMPRLEEADLLVDVAALG